jgi:hypothetical protein
MARPWTPPRVASAIGLLILALARPGYPDRTAYPETVRRPRGIYAVVVLEESGAKGGADPEALLKNPAVSGLAVRAFWSLLQPARDRYDFSRLDAIFALAAAHHKTVQLIVLPGFGTPSWVLDELTSCDALKASTTAAPDSGRGGKGGKHGAHEATREKAHSGPHAEAHGHAARKGASTPETGPTETASAPCGKQTFDVSEGSRHGESKPLPLPWNPVYKAYWRTFLTAVASRFGTNPGFVSIAVTGPTAESAEIIVPRSGDQLERWGELLELSYHDPSYHQSDKAFVEEWEAAAAMYGQVFHGVTLVLTRGSGLLNFTKGQSGEAQSAIVSSFERRPAGSNAKATQTSGLKACRETNGGIRGVKETASNRSLSPPVLGGAQFDTAFSARPASEGCTASCDATAAACTTVTPAQALANVLSVYFDGTPAGAAFHSANGAASLNYLQIYAPDIAYAGTQPSVQSMLEQANARLLAQAR